MPGFRAAGIPITVRKKMTIVLRQIVVIIREFGCRLDRGQPVQQVLLGWFVRTHRVGLLAYLRR
jgi:hypothetical protein